MSLLKPKYCASPWVESLLQLNGNVNLCCRANRIVGNWKKESLSKIYKEDLKEIRADMVAGRPVSQECMGCVVNGTQTEMYRVFETPLFHFVEELKTHPEFKIDSILKISSLLRLQDHTHDSIEILNSAKSELNAIKQQVSTNDLQLVVRKIQILVDCLDDFLSNATDVKHVAPFREVQMVVACNARCIQCVGKFSGEISKGIAVDGVFRKQMTLEESNLSLDCAEDIVTFNMTGSEFLVHKSWKEVALKLRENGILFRNSTNGTLLTPENIRFIVDNDLIRYLFVSVDGVKKETFEYIREWVKFDKLKEHLKYLFEYVALKQYPMDLTITFVVMKDNYSELQQLPDFINSFQIPGSQWPRTQIVVQVLDNRGTEAYLDFVEEHHHSLAPHEKFKESVINAAKRCKELGFKMLWSYNESVDDFIARGCPFEGYKELSRIRVHLDSENSNDGLKTEKSHYYGWAVSKHGIKDVKVDVNGTPVSDVRYGRECPWLKNSFSYPQVENSGLDFYVEPRLYKKGKNTVLIQLKDKLGFEASYSVVVEKP